MNHSVCLIEPTGSFHGQTSKAVCSLYLYMASLNNIKVISIIEQLPMLYIGAPDKYTGTSGEAPPFYSHHSQLISNVLTPGDPYARYFIFSSDYSDGLGAVGDLLGRATECMSLIGGAGTDIIGTLPAPVLQTAIRRFNTNYYSNFYLFNDGTGEMTLPQSVQTKDQAYMSSYYSPSTSSDERVVNFTTINGVVFSNADAETGMTGGYTMRFNAGILELEYYNGINTTTLTHDISEVKGTLCHIAAHFTSAASTLYFNGVDVDNSTVDLLINSALAYTTLGAFYDGAISSNNLVGRYDLFTSFEGAESEALTPAIILDMATSFRSACGYTTSSNFLAPTAILPLFQFNFDDDEYDTDATHSRVKFTDDDRIEATIEIL